MNTLSRRQWAAGTGAWLAGFGLPGATRQARAQPARELGFPRDHGAHPEFRTEWWYLTGVAREAGQGREFGFQITFFRSRPDSVARADDQGSPGDSGKPPGRFAVRQLLFAHVAITDVRSRRLHHDQRLARWNGDESSPLARAASADLAVHIRDWRLERTASGYRARAEGETLGMDLSFTPRQAVLLQGERGLSRKGPLARQFSYYYSHPQLQAKGRLMLDGRHFEVSGSAWMDHEWSDELLDQQAVGWDWIGMNLDDGHCVTAFQMRRKDGGKLWAGGSFRAAGDAQKPAAIYRFQSAEVDFRAQRHWVSPTTRARYPVEWLIRTPADFYTVRAVIDNQELDARGSTGTIYWEGLSDLIDSNGKHVGRGYLEMTGYAGSLVL